MSTDLLLGLVGLLIGNILFRLWKPHKTFTPGKFSPDLTVKMGIDSKALKDL